MLIQGIFYDQMYLGWCFLFLCTALRQTEDSLLCFFPALGAFGVNEAEQSNYSRLHGLL